jgi:PAS domain S-box-containing protein
MGMVASGRAMGRYLELLSRLIDGTVDYAVFLMDPDGRVRTWNAGAEHLLGYRSEEVLGQPFSIFFLPEEIQQGIPRKELDQAAAESRAADDRWAVRKDGSRIWICGVTIALRDSAMQGFGKIMRDHTPMKLAQEQIEQLNEDLRQKIRDYERAMDELSKSQATLQETVGQLERFEEVVVGREIKMASLEKEVAKLRKELTERS